MRWTALHFPNFPLQVRFRKKLPPEPVAVASGGPRPTIVACCPRAATAGIRPGLTASAARALVHELAVYPCNETMERAALEGIATWAQQFTSNACLAPPATLLLETGGSLRLFGGPVELAKRIRYGLAALGFTATLAVAPTALGAELLARAGRNTTIENPATLQPALEPLPLALLDLEASALESLAGIGAETLGSCLRLPRDGLTRRFGQALTDTLDRALGRLPDPRLAFVPPRRFAAWHELPMLVPDAGALVFRARQMLVELCGYLACHSEGVTRLTVSLGHEKREPSRITLKLTVPIRDAADLTRLVHERLSSTTLEQPVAALGLVAEETAPLASTTHSLFGDGRHIADDRELLLARLQARLGEDAVSWLVAFPDHRPERAYRESDAPLTGDAIVPARHRPLWLLPQPLAIGTRNGLPWMEGPFVLVTGPETIESGWWDDRDIARDYFVEYL